MSLTEQYETVFGSSDPSRRKLRDLPYSVRIVSRKRPAKKERTDSMSMPPPEMVESELAQGSASPPKADEEQICVYCYRAECAGCPLRFDDKVTLR